MFRFLLAFALLGGAPAFADDAPAPASATRAVDPLAGLDPKLVAQARALLELTGAKQMAAQILDQMMPQMARMAPTVPAAFWDEVRSRAKPEGLLDLIVPIYVRHFSERDLKGLIKFYKSPLGRKLVAEQPQLMAEAMAAGQEWGKQLAEQAIAPMLQSIQPPPPQASPESTGQ